MIPRLGPLEYVRRYRERKAAWQQFWRVAGPAWTAAAVVGVALVALVYLLRR